jgi:hypothetical protein
LNFGHCDLPFDSAQGGEPVEPLLFVFCDLEFSSGTQRVYLPNVLLC